MPDQKFGFLLTRLCLWIHRILDKLSGTTRKRHYNTVMFLDFLYIVPDQKLGFLLTWLCLWIHLILNKLYVTTWERYYNTIMILGFPLYCAWSEVGFSTAIWLCRKIHTSLNKLPGTLRKRHYNTMFYRTLFKLCLIRSVFVCWNVYILGSIEVWTSCLAPRVKDTIIQCFLGFS